MTIEEEKKGEGQLDTPAPAPTSEPTPKEEIPKPPENIDYSKELEALEGSKRSYTPPKSKDDELRQAKFTLESVKKRIVELGGQLDELPPDERGNQFDNLRNELYEQQAEAEIRRGAKSEDEARYKMWFFKNRIVRSGNVFRDVEEALWLSNRHRTENAMEELKNKQTPSSFSQGPGQRSSDKVIPTLTPEKEAELMRYGFKKTAPGRYEGKKMIYRFDEATKSWVSEKK